MKIYLVGMPGSGKSTLGKRISGTLGLPFVDLDAEIEKREGKSITDIFSQSGEDYFRTVESTLLREWAASENSFIMATGGGAPCFFMNMDLLNETGLTIHLDVPIHTLLERLRSKKDRPLLAAEADEKEDRLRRLLNQRLSVYQKSRITITDPETSRVLKAIAPFLKK